MTQPSTPMTRQEQIFESWMAFHRENPSVYDAFDAMLHQKIAAGYTAIGAGGLISELRHRHSVRVQGEPTFKINQHFVPYYTRLWKLLNPRYADFVRTRRLTSAERRPRADNGEVVPAAPDPYIENTIAMRLLELAR